MKFENKPGARGLGSSKITVWAGIAILGLGCAPLLSQLTARRINLDVKDSAGRPLAGVRVTVTSPDKSDFKKEFTTNRKGQTAFLLPTEFKTLECVLEKPGYQVSRTSVDLAKARKSAEELTYPVSFVLYKTEESSPTQLAEAQKVETEALSFFEQGIESFHAGNFQEAIQRFERALAVKPDFPEAWQNLASAHFRVEDYEKAVKTAEEAVRLNSQSASMIKLLSIAHSKLGDEAKAWEYQEKLKAFPDTEFSAEEAYNLAVAEANRGNDEEAARYFERAILKKPDFALAHYQLGLCCFRLKRWPEARTELERYLALEPEGENAETARALLESIKQNG